MISGFAVVTEAKLGPVSDRIALQIEALLPHFARSLAAARRYELLARETEAMRSALESLTVGVILLSRSLGIRFANAEAERIFASCDGIGQRSGRLSFASPSVEGRLTEALGRFAKASAEGGPLCIFVERPSGMPPYTLLASPSFVSPVSGVGTTAGSLATVFVNDPAGPASLPVPELLGARFGLTATEAEVARLVATGRGVAFAAQELRVSLNTARTHLKSVYSKMGVNHQAQMTRVILASFPTIARFDLW